MNTNQVTYRDSVAERELQILRPILSEIYTQKKSVIKNAVVQALTKGHSATNVLDDVNGKMEEISKLVNDAMTRFHQKYPEFYAVQECPYCGRMCFYRAVFGVSDDTIRIKYRCEACNKEFDREGIKERNKDMMHFHTDNFM